MNDRLDSAGKLPARLVAGALVVVFVVAGAVGLVLPFIPGLLFLAIAAVIVARHFPSTEGWLRGNRAFGKHLDATDAFLALTLSERVQVGSLICLKVLVDGVASVISLAARLLRLVASRA